MAKNPSSIIGVDLGRYSIKSVSLQRKGANRFVLNNYAVHVMEKAPSTSDELAAELRILFKEMGAASKNCAIAVSSSDALIRIIEQPETPPAILRDALRLNGMLLLNQDVKEFVLDCDQVTEPVNNGGTVPTARYLVCGLPRTRLTEVDEGFQKYKKGCVRKVQLAPVCTFNAFEFAKAETFNNEAFVLLDIGHTASTVTVGVKRELMMVRAIDFGAHSIISVMVKYGAHNSETALRQLEENDEATLDSARLALTGLTREISSSIGFFEGRREESIRQVYVSGSLARSKAMLQLLSAELDLPCEAWNPFETCEISLPAHRKKLFAEDFASLNVACGAAAEALRGKE